MRYSVFGEKVLAIKHALSNISFGCTRTTMRGIEMFKAKQEDILVPETAAQGGRR